MKQVPDNTDEVSMFDEVEVVMFDENGLHVRNHDDRTYEEKYPEGRETELDLALNRMFN